jgi:hypothetical protein
MPEYNPPGWNGIPPEEIGACASEARRECPVFDAKEFVHAVW